MMPLHYLQPEIPISVVDLLNDVPPTLSLSIKYQAQCQNLLLFHQIASLISALSSNWFGLLCFKSGYIEKGTKETWIAEMKAWYVNHRLTNSACVTLVHRGVTLDFENSHPRHRGNWNAHHPRHHATFQVGITADWLPITTWNSASVFLIPATITSRSMSLQLMRRVCKFDCN